MSNPDPSVTLEAFKPSHLELLAAWLREPHIAPWYANPEADLELARNPPVGGSQAIIAAGAMEIGYLRWQRVSRQLLDELGLQEIPDGSVDVDILISKNGTGKGVGPQALITLVTSLKTDPAIQLIGVTTELQNTRAHRAFEKAGFRKVRQYEAPGLGLCHLMTIDLRDRDRQSENRNGQ